MLSNSRKKVKKPQTLLSNASRRKPSLRARSKTNKFSVDLSTRITPPKVILKLFSWYLEEKLPEILPDLFRSKVNVHPILHQGVSNYTFHTTSSEGTPLVVRVKQKPKSVESNASWAAYHKEFWIYEKLRTIIPVPRIHKTGIGYINFKGEENEIAFMVQELIPYKTANLEIKEKQHALFWEQIGSLAKKINSVECHGYGQVFNQNSADFVLRSEKEHLNTEKSAANLHRLFRESLLNKVELNRIYQRCAQDLTTSQTSKLFHGDLIGNWSNIFVNGETEIVGVVDWEFAGAGNAAAIELATALYVLYRDGNSPSQVEKIFRLILKGYGITNEEYRDTFEKSVETYLLLNVLKKINRYLEMQDEKIKLSPWQVRFRQNAEQLLRALLVVNRPALINYY